MDPRDKTRAGNTTARAEDWREAVQQLEEKAGTGLKPWTYADREPEKYKRVAPNKRNRSRRTSRNPVPEAPDRWDRYVDWVKRTYAPGTWVIVGREFGVPSGTRGVVRHVDDAYGKAGCLECVEVVIETDAGEMITAVDDGFLDTGDTIATAVQPLDDNWGDDGSRLQNRPSYSGLWPREKRARPRTSRRPSGVRRKISKNPIPSPPSRWEDYIWWAQRTFAPGTAIKLKQDWVGWDNGDYISVPAGYKGEVTDIVVDDLATPPEWFEIIVQIGRGMAFPGARISQQFSPAVIERMGVREWIEPLDDNWANGTHRQPMSRYQLPAGQKHGLLKPNRRTSRRPIREMRGGRRTSRRGLNANPGRPPTRVRMRHATRGTAEIGNGMRYTKTVDVPAGTTGEVVQSYGGHWVVVMDPGAPVPYPTMVVVDTHEQDPYTIVEPYGLEANEVGSGFKRWVEQKYPVGEFVIFKGTTMGHWIDEYGDEQRVPVPPGAEGIVRQRQMGYTDIEILGGRGVPVGTSVVLTPEQVMEMVEPHSGRDTMEENTGYNLSPNARRQRMPRKELRPIVKRARKQGWKVDVTKGGHVRFMPPPSGGSMVIASASASDSRAMKNLRAQLRRAGMEI